MLESRLVVKGDYQEEWKEGYFLSLDELEKLCWDYLEKHYSDPYDGDKKTYIEHWLKTNKL